MTEEIEEKRKFIRFDCVVPIVVIEVRNEAGDEGEAFLDNMSREGMRIVVSLAGANFGPGAELKFQFLHPDQKTLSVACGEIIWSRSKGDKVEVGLKIRSMEKAAKAALLDLGYARWRKERSQSSK